MANHYVNNQEFLAAIKQYKQDVIQAEQQGQPKPRIPNFIGECIMKIATHLAYRPNFVGYSYRDEMVSDAIENSLMYFDNFNPERSSNPFAYFTQIAYFAFVRRIKREKSQSAIKGRLVMDMAFDAYDLQDQDDGEAYTVSYLEFIKTHGVYDEVVDAPKAPKARKKIGPTLDDLFEGEIACD